MKGIGVIDVLRGGGRPAHMHVQVESVNCATACLLTAHFH
jgi:hypothetical protein